MSIAFAQALRVTLLALLVVSAPGCGSSEVTAGPPSRPAATASASLAAPASAGASADSARVAGWRADIESLLPRMANLHPRLDHGTPRTALDAAASALEARVATASDDALMVGVLRVVAMVSAKGCDAHTGAFVWGTGTYPVHSLPLRLWWFDDGIHIVDVLAGDRGLVGARIERVAGHPIAEVLEAIEPLIPRDNDATVRLLMPRYLLMPEILRGLDLAGPGPIDLQVTDAAGAAREVSLDALAMTDYNAWAGPYGLHLPADPAVPYLSRMDDALWWTRLDDGTMFVQENRVDRTDASTLDDLRAELSSAGTRRVVLDLRHNYGGEVDAVEPFVSLFRGLGATGGRPLFVITGRNTFSAASLMVAQLEAIPGVTIAGEPMGGCPTAYGDADELTLPSSGIVVDVATLLEVGVAADDARSTIIPTLPAITTFADWAARIDRPLTTIEAAP
jgi:hypothetical protein